jgi:hypothetical protein
MWKHTTFVTSLEQEVHVAFNLLFFTQKPPKSLDLEGTI